MKKFSILLATIFASSAFAQTVHTFEQYNDGDVFSTSTPLCSDATNHNSRLYDLASYGITEAFTLTHVDFGASATAGTSAWVEAATVTGEFNSANMQIGSAFGSIDFPADVSAQWHEVELLDTQTFPAGSKFAVAVAYEWVTGGTRLWFGNNDLGETAPSYIGWPGSTCVGDDPTPVADLGFPVAWLLSVTGTTESMGVVELNSKSLSIYPNPATDVLNISLKNSDIQNIEITNLAGQSVFAGKAANSVNVNFLAAGVYVVKVKDNAGKTHISKFVKK